MIRSNILCKFLKRLLYYSQQFSYPNCTVTGLRPTVYLVNFHKHIFLTPPKMPIDQTKCSYLNQSNVLNFDLKTWVP